MIVVGSTGKSGIERFMLGSVSEKVVRYSRIPVIVVHERIKPERLFSYNKENEKVPPVSYVRKCREKTKFRIRKLDQEENL